MIRQSRVKTSKQLFRIGARGKSVIFLNFFVSVYGAFSVWITVYNTTVDGKLFWVENQFFEFSLNSGKIHENRND